MDNSLRYGQHSDYLYIRNVPVMSGHDSFGVVTGMPETSSRLHSRLRSVLTGAEFQQIPSDTLGYPNKESVISEVNRTDI